jgi:ribonuclease HI
MRLIVHLRTGSKGSSAVAMAAGIIVESIEPHHEVHYAAGHFLGVVPRGKAEAVALMHAIDVARKLNPEEVAILADSQGLVNRITGQTIESDTDLADAIQEVQAALLSLDLWTIRHLPKDDVGKSERLVRAALDAEKSVVVVDEFNPSNAPGFESLKPDPAAFERAGEPAAKKRVPLDLDGPSALDAEDDPDRLPMSASVGPSAMSLPEPTASKPRPASNTGPMNLERFRVTLEGSDGCPRGNADGVCFQFGPTTPPGLCVYAAQAAFAVDPLHWRSPNHRRIITSCAKCKAGVSVEPG